MHDIDGMIERFHDLAIVPSEFTESLCSFLKNGDDGLYGATGFELLSEGMVRQFCPCQFFSPAGKSRRAIGDERD